MQSGVVSVRFQAEDRGVLDAISALRVIEGCEMRTLGAKLIVDRYFDTSGWRLYGKGCTYRERMIDRHRWVAFRGSPEIIANMPDPADVELPDGTKLDDVEELLPPIMRAWVAADRAPLGRILTTENNRMLVELVEEGEPRFLMCLDDIEFFSNGSQRRCCEVKLDVRRDPNYTMRWLAGQLRTQFGLTEIKTNRLELGLTLTGAEPIKSSSRVIPDIHAALRPILAS